MYKNANWRHVVSYQMWYRKWFILGWKRKTQKTIGIYVQQIIQRSVNGTSEHRFFSESRDPRQSSGKLNFHRKSTISNYEPCCGPAKTIFRKLGVSTSILGFYDSRLRKNTWLSDCTNLRRRSFSSRSHVVQL